MRVILTATASASQRTKNRIEEHGPEFEVDPIGRARPGWTLYLSASDPWWGWLPDNEVRLTRVVE